MRKHIRNWLSPSNALTELRGCIAEGVLRFYWQKGRNGPMRRPLPVIVSLTSFPPRFGTLHLTLKSLLLQDCLPSKLILWVAHDDHSLLPRSVLELQDYGVEVRLCDDLRSYKKIIPALNAFPDDTIVIADDDVFYTPDWLSQIFNASVNLAPNVAVARRGHKILRDRDLSLLPYRAWNRNIGPHLPHSCVFATGMGGVLYPPGIFDDEVFNIGKALELCPSGDDIWLYWMVRLKGNMFSKIGGPVDYAGWRGTNASSLNSLNVPTGVNDLHIRRMLSEYGNPVSDK